ncbi:unnamed protein product [Euphydryas editha]|uniref:Uncharacterized protein n=1 Tax=Euphydryas editha TaxID=104508 RepID=A0AAU9TR92_EUPED|nr:unnamed protein product [Euphydryas editha]
MCPSPYHSVRAAATPVSTVKIFREPSVASHVPGVCERVNTCRCSACCRSRVHKAAKIRVKNREPVPAYAMADADRDSDLGDDSPVVSQFCLPVNGLYR